MTAIQEAPTIESRARRVEDRLDVIDATSRLCVLIDARDWDGVERLFAEQVDLDYTALNGGEAQTVRPADIVAGWRAALEPLATTQHLLGNHLIEVLGDEATCVANVQGTHSSPCRTGSPLWVVGGRYDFRLRRGPSGWRITAMKLSVQWASGNRNIMLGKS